MLSHQTDLPQSTLTVSVSPFNISPKTFDELGILGIDLNALYILFAKDQGWELKETPKILGWTQALIRYGYLEDNVVTTAGKQLIEHIQKDHLIAPNKKEEAIKLEKSFDDWWKAYPAGDTFEYQGKRFEGSRSFKVKKEECRAKFNAIIKQGEYSVEDMIQALEFEVLQKKKKSFLEKNNKLQFMHNSLTYLNQKDYEGMFEQYKQFKPKKDAPSITGTFSI